MEKPISLSRIAGSEVLIERPAILLNVIPAADMRSNNSSLHGSCYGVRRKHAFENSAQKVFHHLNPRVFQL